MQISIRISETDRKILEVIKEKGNPGYRAIAATLQRNPSVIRRHVRNCLLERGLVEAQEGGGWKITSLGLQALERRQRLRRNQHRKRQEKKPSFSSRDRRFSRVSPRRHDSQGQPSRRATRGRSFSRGNNNRSRRKSSDS